MLDGKLDVGEYQKIKAKIEPEIERLIVRVSELSKGDLNEQDMVEFGFYFLNNMTGLFAEADLDVKRYMLGSTIREKVIFQDGKYRTASGDNFLLDLAYTGAALGDKKRRKAELFGLPSRRVEANGIEPRILCL